MKQLSDKELDSMILIAKRKGRNCTEVGELLYNTRFYSTIKSYIYRRVGHENSVIPKCDIDILLLDSIRKIMAFFDKPVIPKNPSAALNNYIYSTVRSVVSTFVKKKNKDNDFFYDVEGEVGNSLEASDIVSITPQLELETEESITQFITQKKLLAEGFAPFVESTQRFSRIKTLTKKERQKLTAFAYDKVSETSKAEMIENHGFPEKTYRKINDRWRTYMNPSNVKLSGEKK